MKTVSNRRPSLPFLSGYSNNAVLQLIIASGVGFVIYHFLIVILLMVDLKGVSILSFTGLPPLVNFKDHWWTLITYGWAHAGFWELLSNMLWLYCFGSVVQSLVGYKQVIPLFVYSLLIGGVFYLCAQLIPGIGSSNMIILGARAGIMALAVAAVTIAPRYRFFLGPSFSMPILVVAGIFLVLMLLSTSMQPTLLMLLAGGGLTGFAYIRLLRGGYRPGEWIYDIFNGVERVVTPNEGAWKKRGQKRSQVLNKMGQSQHGIHQKRVDEILDKINQHGYDTLSAEEKDILVRASKEKL